MQSLDNLRSDRKEAIGMSIGLPGEMLLEQFHKSVENLNSMRRAIQQNIESQPDIVGDIALMSGYLSKLKRAEEVVERHRLIYEAITGSAITSNTPVLPAGGAEMEKVQVSKMNALLSALKHGAQRAIGRQVALQVAQQIKVALGDHYPSAITEKLGPEVEGLALCAVVYTLADTFNFPMRDMVKNVALKGLEGLSADVIGQMSASIMPMLLPAFSNIALIQLTADDLVEETVAAQ